MNSIRIRLQYIPTHLCALAAPCIHRVDNKIQSFLLALISHKSDENRVTVNPNYIIFTSYKVLSLHLQHTTLKDKAS